MRCSRRKAGGCLPSRIAHWRSGARKAKQSSLRRQGEFEQARVHQTYLSQVEGAKRNPSIDVLERIATALKTDIAGLFKP